MTVEQMKESLLEDPASVAAAIAGAEEGSAPGEGGVSLLWELSADAGEPRQVKKAAKKALYLLRSRGVDVDRYRPRPEPSVRRGGVAPEAGAGGATRLQVFSSLLSIPDSSLANVLVLPVGRSEDQAYEVYFVEEVEAGVRQVSSGRGNRRQVERFARENPRFLPVEPGYALSRLGRALARTENPGPGLRSLPPVLRDAEDRGLPHPVLEEARGALSRVIDPELEKQLFFREEVGWLELPDEEVSGYREQVRQARSSRLIIGNLTPEQRVEAVEERFYRAYFTPRRLEHLCVQLMDLALYFHRRGEPSFTGLLLEYAEGLRRVQASLSPDAASGHPFLQYLVYRSLIEE
ncbi:MAG: hypothetical protein ACOC8N_05545 [Spirochaetota bacterium]